MSFTKTVEDFVCGHCGAYVMGNGYTNHCPRCLWSKHVDQFPGDRLNPCRSLMEPMEVTFAGGEFRVTHRCLACGTVSKNKLSAGDNVEAAL